MSCNNLHWLTISAILPYIDDLEGFARFHVFLVPATKEIMRVIEQHGELSKLNSVPLSNFDA